MLIPLRNGKGLKNRFNGGIQERNALNTTRKEVGRF